MIKLYSTILRRFLIVADIFIVISTFFGASNYFMGISVAEVVDQHLILLVLHVIVWPVLLYRDGSYKSFRTKNFIDVAFIVFKSSFFGLIILSAILFLLDMPRESRDLLAYSFVSATIFLCAHKAILLSGFHHLRKNDYNTRNLLIAGANRRAFQFISLVEKNVEWGMKIIGVVDSHKESVGSQLNGKTIIGTFDDIPSILHQKAVDEVVFIVPRLWLDRIKDVITFCETEGVSTSVSLDLFDLKIAKSRQIDLHGFPMVVFETTSSDFWHLSIKRTFDILISLLGLMILFVPLLFVGVMIKISSKGPVLFAQKRKGLHGREFTMYKFRTMVCDAEEKLEHVKSLNQMNGPAFKMDKDPRVTPLGKILRKFSIDEFPQLWNVLIGDMSIIGPRPPLISEVDFYESWQRRRLSMRPGLTCLWQINGRNKIVDFHTWAELDLKYIDNWSLMVDLKIFLKTIPVVLFGIGAK
jgi:exopolysaccharide biosynthesis polyprenyl glycosylphosphotransferase